MSDPSAPNPTVPKDYLTKEDDDLISKMPLDGAVYTKHVKLAIIDRDLCVVSTKDGQVTGKTPLARAIAHDIGTIAQFNATSDSTQAGSDDDGNDDDKKRPASPSFLNDLKPTPMKQARQGSNPSSPSSNDGKDSSDDNVFHDVPERQLDDSLNKSSRALLEYVLEGWDALAADQCSRARKCWGEHDCEARCLMFERYYYDRVQNCRRGTKSERKAVLKDYLIPQFFLEAVIPFPIQKRYRPKWEAKANSTIGANPKY